MAYLKFISLIIVITSCTALVKNKSIVIGNYEFTFPRDYDLHYTQGIDSQPGYIKGDSTIIGYDYGYFANSLVETPEQYLKSGIWKIGAFYQFLEPEKTYYNQYWNEIITERWELKSKTDSLRNQNYDYLAYCKYKDTEFTYEIVLPEEIKTHEFEVDTLDGHLRKIVIAHDSNKGTTGMFIFELNKFNESLNGSLSLSISTSRISKSQQESILSIFRSVKVVQ